MNAQSLRKEVRDVSGGPHRVDLYAERLQSGRDIWTGEPLPPMVLADVQAFMRAANGRELSRRCRQ